MKRLTLGLLSILFLGCGGEIGATQYAQEVPSHFRAPAVVATLGDSTFTIQIVGDVAPSTIRTTIDNVSVSTDLSIERVEGADGTLTLWFDTATLRDIAAHTNSVVRLGVSAKLSEQTRHVSTLLMPMPRPNDLERSIGRAIAESLPPLSPPGNTAAIAGQTMDDVFAEHGAAQYTTESDMVFSLNAISGRNFTLDSSVDLVATEPGLSEGRVTKTTVSSSFTGKASITIPHIGSVEGTLTTTVVQEVEGSPNQEAADQHAQNVHNATKNAMVGTATGTAAAAKEIAEKCEPGPDTHLCPLCVVGGVCPGLVFSMLF